MGLPQAVSTMREYKILKRLRVTPVSPVFILGVDLTMYIAYCSVSLAVPYRTLHSAFHPFLPLGISNNHKERRLRNTAGV